MEETQGEQSESSGIVILLVLMVAGAGFAWLVNRGPDPLTSGDLLSRMSEAGIECTDETSFRPPGPHATVYERGSCQTSRGLVHFFLYDKRISNDAELPDYVDAYPGAYAVVGHRWAVVTEGGREQASAIATAVAGDVLRIETDLAPAGSAGGDLDCDSPGVGTNVIVAAGDPHGLDADGDGIGCES